VTVAPVTKAALLSDIQDYVSVHATCRSQSPVSRRGDTPTFPTHTTWRWGWHMDRCPS